MASSFSTAYEQTLSTSFLVSADMAHSINPNYAGKYESDHYEPQRAGEERARQSPWRSCVQSPPREQCQGSSSKNTDLSTAYEQTLSTSFLVSADMAHSINPNYAGYFPA
jgi:aspartyl aminopeptidase